jgi:DNA-binding MarR family transcriptional regulator
VKSKSRAIPADQIYQRPGFLLRRAHQLSVALFEQYCKELNLTPPQYGILSMLSHVKEIDQGTLSKALGHDKVTTLHIVRGLEARGLLTRTVSSSGRRRMLIRLTDAGRSLREQAEAGAALAYEHLLSPLKRDEQTKLLGLLARLCDDLESSARAPMVKLVSDDAAG